MKKKVLVGGCLAAVVLIVAVVLVIAAQPKKINVEDYVQISYSGYEGYATASVSLDRNGLYEAVLEAIGKHADNVGGSYLGASGAKTSSEQTLYECIDGIELSLSQTDNLSNGDCITVSITYDNALAKKQKIQFTGDSVSVTVEGLEDVVEIDPFEGLEVVFSGISPYGQAEWNYSGADMIDRYSFFADRNLELKNGDIVTISYQFNENEMLEQGYVVTRSEAAYEVSGLDEYVMNYAELTEEFLSGVKGQAEDVIYAYAAGSYSSGSGLGDLTYAGYVFNGPKDGAVSESVNRLYVIYSGTVSNSEGNFSSAKVYFPVLVCDIVKTENGEISGSQAGIVGSSALDAIGWYTTKGYINPLLAYTELAEAARDRYVCECGDGFENYAEYAYVMHLSDISDAHKQELYADAEDIVASYLADYRYGVRAQEPVFVGEYLLTAKNQGTDFAGNNTYFVVYSAVVFHESGRFDTTTVYFPVAYKGIVNLPEDAYLVVESDGIQGRSYLDSWSSYWTDGYVDGTEMYQKLITANRELYNYEVSEGLRMFGE